MLIFVFACTSFFTFAETTNTNQQEQIKELSEQNIRLQEQSKMLKSSIDNYNNIIFSSLGFAGTFLIAFLGVNIYFMKNRADEDKKNIEQIIKEKNKESLMKLSKFITKEINKNIGNLENKISSQTASISSQVKTEFDSIDRKIKHIHYNLAVNEYEKEQCSDSKLTSTINIIKHSEVAGFTWKTSKTLTEMQSLLKSGGKYDPSELPDVFNVLRKISEPNKKLALEVETLILRAESQS